jgi:hypothetical protein
LTARLRPTTILFMLAIAAAAAALGLACEEQTSHVYAGELYDPDADCLYPTTSLDFVLDPPEGSAAECDAQCISDSVGQLFLGTTCPPWPVEFNGASSTPGCIKALAARCRQCPLDGGGVRIVCDTGTN